MKSVTLPSCHYASKWKTDGVVKQLEEVNAIGRRYAELPEENLVEDRKVSNPEKQNLLLELCQCFHPYLMKYLVMICHGHMPIVGVGNAPARMNKDVRPFLLYFLPKGQKPSYQNLSKVVKQLHLAFKGMETEEIYDVLMEQLVGALKGYDPNYKVKVKLVVETIEEQFEKRKQFSATDINRHVDIDSNRYLRLLGRLGFLEQSKDKAEPKVTVYSRTTSWPPPVEFFKGTPIGVAYYLQKWFRFGLQDWVSRRIRELEAKEGVYSLEAWQEFRSTNQGTSGLDGGGPHAKDMGLPDFNGSFSSTSGTAISADTSMTSKPLDISKLNLEWVNHTNDPVFSGLSKNDRYIIYLVYARGMDNSDVADAIGCDQREVRTRLTTILSGLRTRFESSN